MAIEPDPNFVEPGTDPITDTFSGARSMYKLRKRMYTSSATDTSSDSCRSNLKVSSLSHGTHQSKRDHLNDASSVIESDAVESDTVALPSTPRLNPLYIVNTDQHADVTNPYTITPPLTPSTANLLSEITFLEGDQGLRRLPDHLYEQLKMFCQITNTDKPTCVRTKWSPVLTLSSSEEGRPAWFENPRTGAVVSVARYQYGQKDQFIVAKEDARIRYPFNNGEAAIITYISTARSQATERGRKVRRTQWHVWDPLQDERSSCWVWRVCEGKSVVVKPQDAYSESSGDESTSSSDLTSEDDPEQSIVPAVRRCAIQGSLVRKGRQRAFDSGDSTGELGPARKRVRCTQAKSPDETVEVSPLLASDKTGTCKKPNTEGGAGDEFELGTVQYTCVLCDEGAYSTRFGLLTHMQMRHNITHNEVESSSRCDSTIVDPAQSSPGVDIVHKITRDVRPAVAEPVEVQEPQVRFLSYPPSTNTVLRMRPLSAIDSAQKLFVNALVARIASRDILMLTAHISGMNDLVNVVRGDEEDFEVLLEGVAREKGKGRDVVVRAWVEDLVV